MLVRLNDIASDITKKHILTADSLILHELTLFQPRDQHCFLKLWLGNVVYLVDIPQS